MKKNTVLAFSVFVSILANAQVGIGTTSPNNSAMLHVKSKSKGLLVPMVPDLEGVVNGSYDPVLPDTGLIVFLEPDRKFYYHDGDDWICMTPFNAEEPEGGDIGRITNSVEYPEANLYGSFTGEFNGYGATPLGGIIMWSGDPTNLPSGWALCDGQVYIRETGEIMICNPGGNCTDCINDADCILTPNLKGRFVVGYDPNSSATPGNAQDKEINYGDVGNTGGTNPYALADNEVPLRDHMHNLEGNTVFDGEHRHIARNTLKMEETKGDNRTFVRLQNGDNTGLDSDYYINLEDGEHSHRISQSTETQTGTFPVSSHENRPPYYVLAFIMRIR